MNALKSCAWSGCANLYEARTKRMRFCSRACSYEVVKVRSRMQKTRIKACKHPECANLFRSSRAQLYCDPACTADDARCGVCGDLVDRPNARKNGVCRLCERVKRYGLTAAGYKAMLAEQRGRCAICERAPEDVGVRPLVVDHCHASGVVRGLLCAPCNMAIGLLGDDLATVASAAKYLEAR